MTLASLVSRHIRAVRASLPGALRGDAGEVHKVRVSSRRLRELLPVVAGRSPGRRVKKLRRFARTLTRTLGPVREMDVAIEQLAFLEAREHLRGIAAVRRAIAAERGRRRRAMLERMGGGEAARKLDRLASSKMLGGVEDLRRDAPALVAAWLLARAARLEEAIEAAGSLYEVERLHEARIAVKKLRYSLELVQELRLGRVAPDLRRLKGAQNLLGSLHDLEVLAGHARSLDAKAPPGPGRRVLVGVLEEELRHHHARFLRGRDALSGVIARVRQRGGELAGLETAGSPVMIGGPARAHSR
ncbi:MAG: CHAD domain-containing protein [Acidobacteria bacterium]|nr:CHAD domain-containing protein [Acidobacteriota bacterium]